MSLSFPTLLLSLLSQQADFDELISSLIGYGGGRRVTSFDSPDEAGIYSVLTQHEDATGELVTCAAQFAVDWQRGLLLLQNAQLELRPFGRCSLVQAWLIEPTGHVGLLRESATGRCALLELVDNFETAA